MAKSTVSPKTKPVSKYKWTILRLADNTEVEGPLKYLQERETENWYYYRVKPGTKLRITCPTSGESDVYSEVGIFQIEKSNLAYIIEGDTEESFIPQDSKNVRETQIDEEYQIVNALCFAFSCPPRNMFPAEFFSVGTIEYFDDEVLSEYIVMSCEFINEFLREVGERTTISRVATRDPKQYILINVDILARYITARSNVKNSEHWTSILKYLCELYQVQVRTIGGIPQYRLQEIPEEGLKFEHGYRYCTCASKEDETEDNFETYGFRWI